MFSTSSPVGFPLNPPPPPTPEAVSNLLLSAQLLQNLLRQNVPLAFIMDTAKDARKQYQQAVKMKVIKYFSSFHA